MIISIDRASRSGYAYYLINRDKDSYTILEGSQKSFDTYAQNLLQLNLTNEEFHPYFRTVLSFEEEDLTIDDLTEAYNRFKELFYKNYDEAEYELFSVIHWDDNKPHIHIGTISNSLINDKGLRLMRGNLDIDRVDAIAEQINYEFGYKSAKESIPLFKLSPAQQKRDWKVKKGKLFYSVPDDEIQYFISKQIPLSNNFNDFISKLKSRYPNLEIVEKEYETIKTSDSKEKILQLNNISSSNEPINSSFKSFLFDEVWFNKNLSKLKKIDNIFDFRAKLNRKTYEDYINQYNRLTLNHSLELDKRNIHSGLLEHKLKLVQLESGVLNPEVSIDLKNLSVKKIKEIDNFNLQLPPTPDLLTHILSITQNLQTKDEIELIFSITDKKLIPSDNEGEIIIVDKATNDFQVINDITLFQKLNTTKDDLLEKSSLMQKNISLKDSISELNPYNRYELNLIKKNILEKIFTNDIDDVSHLIDYLSEAELKIVRVAEDNIKGKYVTLNYKNKNFAIYSKYLYNLINYSNDINYQENKYSATNKDNSLLHSTLSGKNKYNQKPESLNEFKMKKFGDFSSNIELVTNDLDTGINLIGFNTSTSNRNRKLPYKTTKTDNKNLEVTNCINYNKFATDFLNSIMQSDIKEIKLTGDYKFQEKLLKEFVELSNNPLYKNYLEKLPILSSINKNKIIIQNYNFVTIQNNNNLQKSYKPESTIEKDPILKQLKNLSNISRELQTIHYSNHDDENIVSKKKLLILSSKFNDMDFFNKITEQINLNYAPSPDKNNIKFNDKNDKEHFQIKVKSLSNIGASIINTAYNTTVVDNPNEVVKKEKEEIIEKGIYQSFSNYPELNYSVDFKSSKKISPFETKKHLNKTHIIEENQSSIKLIKSKNIDESLLYIKSLLLEKNGLSIQNINGSDPFKSYMTLNLEEKLQNLSPLIQ